MDSSSIYRSPCNVQITNLKIEGGPYLPCPHLGCILVFSAPGSLQWHSWTRKHKFASNLSSPPSSAHLLQWFKPWLMVETPAKTPHTGQTSDLQQPVPFYCDSEGSDNKLSPLGFSPLASPTHLSPLNSPTPTTQEGSTLHVHSSLLSSSHTSTTLSSNIIIIIWILWVTSIIITNHL